MSELKIAISTHNLVWVTGEPVHAITEVKPILKELLDDQPPFIWTAATGLGHNWGGEVPRQPAKKYVKNLVEAQQELLIGLLEAGTGETDSKYPAGLIVLAEGIQLTAGHIQAAAMKVISGDGRVVFVSSGDPPDGFLTDYLRRVELDYGDPHDRLKKTFERNKRAYNTGYGDTLLGIRPYRSVSVVAEAIALKDEGDELDYIRSRRGAAIREDSQDIVTLLEPKCTFDDLIGLERAKELLRALGKQDLHRVSKGVLLLGLPGTGKTRLAEAAAAETNLPLYVMDVGAVFGMYVGQTQSRTRRALQVVSSAPPGFLLLDELEKSLSGVDSRSANMTGSNTSVQAGMYLLNYMNNPVAGGGTYHRIIGTSNDVLSLPAEFTRAGRWNAVFSFLLPREEQLVKVLDLYRKRHKLSKKFGKDTTLQGMTPADVEAVCQIAESLSEFRGEEISWDTALQYVPILNRFRPDDVAKVEEECRGRAVSADLDEAVEKLIGKSDKVKR